jgi:hypothetical protein
VVVGLEREEKDNAEQVKVDQDNDLESDRESIAAERESATEFHQEERLESHKSNLVSTSNEDDEDSDDTAVSLAATELCVQSKLELDSPQAQVQSAERVMEQEPASFSCLDINSDNVLDHLPHSLSKSLMFMEQFFEKSTDLTAKGITLGMKPFEMAFGLHLKPAFESSKLFVLKQKSTIVDIVKKRAMSA